MRREDTNWSTKSNGHGKKNLTDHIAIIAKKKKTQIDYFCILIDFWI